jgi:hypothetical protein
MTIEYDKSEKDRNVGYVVCEYFAQPGDDCANTYCDECHQSLSEYDFGHGSVFYSVGPESVRWSIGDGMILCPGCIGNDAKRAVKPME